MKIQDSEWYTCDAHLHACVNGLERQCDVVATVMTNLAERIQDAEIANALRSFSVLLEPIKTQVHHLNHHMMQRYVTYIDAIDTVDSSLY